LWFTVLGFLRPAIQVFLLPLYLVKLSPSEYGMLALILIFSSLFGTVVGLRLNVAANTFYFDHNQNEESLKDYIGQLFTFLLVLALLAFACISLTGQFVFDHLFSNANVPFYPLGIIATGQVLLSTCNSIYLVYLKNSFKVKEFVLLNSLVIILSVIIQAILILVYDFGILGILIGSFVPVALLFLYLIMRHRFLLNFKLNYEIIKPSLIFSLGFLPVGFLVVFEKQIDKLILERFMDLEHVGLYALLISVVGLFNILTRAYDNAIKPVLYQALKNDDEHSESTLNRMYGTYTAIGILSLAGILLVGNHLHLITDNPKYLSIANYFPFAVLASVPLILVKYEILVILFYKKTLLLSIITLFKTSLLFVVMILLIPKYGINGAIAGILISNVLNLVSFKFMNSRLSNYSFKYLHLLFRIVPFITLIALHTYLGGLIGYSWSSVLVFGLTFLFIFFAEKDNVMDILTQKNN